jgi:hypothetical protein
MCSSCSPQSRKWTSVALEEVIAGKIQPKKPEEAEKAPVPQA